MKRLEYLKVLVAIAILGTAYNAHFDLIGIPRREELHLAFSCLCLMLFLIGLYHDRLGKQLMKRVRSEDHHSFSLAPKASRELIFHELLLSFLLFIPVIPALLRFPKEPYLGLSLFLFPLHGMVRAYRTKWMKGMELIIGEERMVYSLRSNRSIRYDDLSRVEVKYEHLYFVLKDDRVETLPMDFLPKDRTTILKRLAQRLEEKDVKGRETLQELGGSENSKV